MGIFRLLREWREESTEVINLITCEGGCMARRQNTTTYSIRDGGRSATDDERADRRALQPTGRSRDGYDSDRAVTVETTGGQEFHIPEDEAVDIYIDGEEA